MDAQNESDKNNGDISNTKAISNHKMDPNIINSIKSKADVAEIALYSKDDRDSPVERVKFEGIDDNDSILSDESEEESLPPIPDGGWGWVVVVSAFLVSACADGLAFSFGLLHEEFTAYFETTQSKTSLIGSFFIATPLLVGPIMSALVDRYGCRVMTIIAGLLSTLGFLLAAVSDSIAMLCLTFGLMSGLAMGILYVTAVVSVAFWFDKRRNLAVSLASCGIGFGTLIYSPMTSYFLTVYDWRNTIVLLAGTLLNMCVCGAVMRNPEWLEIKQKRQRRLSKVRSKRSSSAGSISSRSLAETEYMDEEELKALLKSGKSPEYILATLASSIAEAEQLEAITQMNAEQTIKRTLSVLHVPTFVQHNEKVQPEVIEKLVENPVIYNIILQNYPDAITRRRSETNLASETLPTDAANPTKLPVEIKAKKPVSNVAKDEKHNDKSEATKSNSKINSSQDRKSKEKTKDLKGISPQHNWLRQISTTDRRYFRDVPLYRNTMMHRGAMMSIPRYKLKALSLPDMYRNSVWSFDSESDDEMKWYHRLWQILKKSFDFKMFTEFHFLMFNLSTIILSVWFIVPYFFLNSYMTKMNMEGGAMMISIIGIASAVGIVALGWAGDQPWINVTKTYAVCLIICGLSIGAYPLFITNYWALTVVSTVFGLSFASSYSYIPALLMELLPIDRFTVAYGLILLSEGIGHLVGPPLAGLIYDLTSSWELTFYVGGFWLIISGLCVGVIAYTDNRRLCGTAPLLNDAAEDSSVASSEPVRV